MGILEPITSHPYAQALFPTVFFTLGIVIALPQFLFNLAFHPLAYLTSPDPVSVAKSKFFYYAWRVMSPALDPGDKPVKAPLLAKCYGTVVEIGPGVGDNIKYYHRTRVERLVLVEPNTDMHSALRSKANNAGYFEKDASLLILGCGGAASDEPALAAAGVGPETVDCVASIHVLCGIPNPALAIELYRRLLKPNGLLVFYEHVRSDQPIAASWQRWYNNFWPTFFDGCCLDRPTGAWIAEGPQAADGKGLVSGLEMVNGADPVFDGGRRWKQIKMERPKGHQKDTCLPHVLGWAIKP
ncbi:MAG: hypothetical protein M1828_005560 [Chrysothrix sp. TS-e1954]|nr:MAG: hypothetical protein M1828_005560 [Chrysothrix sp. TS-e1954]